MKIKVNLSSKLAKFSFLNHILALNRVRSRKIGTRNNCAKIRLHFLCTTMNFLCTNLVLEELTKLSRVYFYKPKQCVKNMARNQLTIAKSNNAAKIKPNNWRTHVTIGFRFYQRK